MPKTRYYDRYERFRTNGNFRIVPLIDIAEYDTDLHITFDRATMRMDTLSYKYYGYSDYGWLIMLANPSVGSLEYNIKTGTKIRIPYPLDTALSRYDIEVNNYLDKTT